MPFVYFYLNVVVLIQSIKWGCVCQAACLCLVRSHAETKPYPSWEVVEPSSFISRHLKRKINDQSWHFESWSSFNYVVKYQALFNCQFPGTRGCVMLISLPSFLDQLWMPFLRAQDDLEEKCGSVCVRHISLAYCEHIFVPYLGFIQRMFPNYTSAPEVNSINISLKSCERCFSEWKMWIRLESISQIGRIKMEMPPNHGRSDH